MEKLILTLLVVLPALARADKTFTKSAAWDCKKDPVVVINKGDGSYTFKGACKSITVNGAGVTLKIEQVDQLGLNGGGSIAKVGTVAAIDVNGSGNTVRW